MEKINARKSQGQGRRWRERRVMEEKKFPWQADEQVDEGRSGKDTRRRRRTRGRNETGGASPLIM